MRKHHANMQQSKCGCATQNLPPGPQNIRRSNWLQNEIQMTSGYGMSRFGHKKMLWLLVNQSSLQAAPAVRLAGHVSNVCHDHVSKQREFCAWYSGCPNGSTQHVKVPNLPTRSLLGRPQFAVTPQWGHYVLAKCSHYASPSSLLSPFSLTKSWLFQF